MPQAMTIRRMVIPEFSALIVFSPPPEYNDVSAASWISEREIDIGGVRFSSLLLSSSLAIFL